MLDAASDRPLGPRTSSTANGLVALSTNQPFGHIWEEKIGCECCQTGCPRMQG